MTTNTSDQDALARHALRFIDGASEPVLVEQLYVDWDLGTTYRLSFAGTRDRVAGWWPTQGVAWEKFRDVINAYIADGTFVMCCNTDPVDHPEYHLTQGVQAEPFRWGTPPLVLRYITTPAGSIAWREVLARRAANRLGERQRQAAHAELAASQVQAAVSVRPLTERGIRAATGYSRTDVRAALLTLSTAGRLRVHSRTLLGGTRWRAATTEQATTATADEA